MFIAVMNLSYLILDHLHTNEAVRLHSVPLTSIATYTALYNDFVLFCEKSRSVKLICASFFPLRLLAQW